MEDKYRNLLEATEEYLKCYDYLKQYDTIFEWKDIDDFDRALIKLRAVINKQKDK